MLSKQDRYKWSAFVLTFLAYTSYHLSRKPSSIVKNVLHPSSPGGLSTYNNVTNPGWGPFNQDLVPEVVAKAGYTVADAGVDVVNGVYKCGDGEHSGLCKKFKHEKANIYITLPAKKPGKNVTKCWRFENANNQKYYYQELAEGTRDCPDLPFISSKGNTTSWKVGKIGKSPGPDVLPDITNGKILLGSLDTTFLTCYAVGLFLMGHVGDQVNLRIFLTIGMCGSGVMIFLIGMAKVWKIQSLWYFVACYGVQGFFQATGWPGVVAVIGRWFGQKTRGLALGVWNSHTSVGNILGSIVSVGALSIGTQHDDAWQWAFFLPAIIIFVMGLVMFLFLTPHPHDVGLQCPDDYDEVPNPEASIQSVQPVTFTGEELSPASEEETDGEGLGGHPFIKALLLPGVLQYAFALFFAKLVAYTFLFWLPLYLTHLSYTTAEAGYLSTFFDIGGIIGGITIGFLSDKLGMRAFMAWLYLLLAIPALYFYRSLTISIGDSSTSLNVLLMLVLGSVINGPYALITTAVSADLGTQKAIKGNASVLASVTGIIDGTGSAGAAIQGLLIGWISSKYGWTAVFDALVICCFLASLLLINLVYRDVRRKCCGRQQDLKPVEY